MTETLISIVIANHNGMEFLPECLESLFAQDHQRTEVILVDNASLDGSADFAERKFPEVKVIRSDTNLGYAGGNNLGALHCKGEFLLFLNHDTRVTATFLTELLEVMKRQTNVGIVQSKMLQARDPDLIDSIGSYFTRTGILLHSDNGCPDSPGPMNPREVFGATGACLMIRSEIFKILEGFDSDYVIYFEDTDLSWRTWLLGYKVMVVLRSVIYHQGGATTQHHLPSQFTVYHSFKNRICSLIKLLSTRNILVILPLHLFICLGGSLAYFFRFKIANGLAILRAIAWNVRNLPQTMRKRRTISRLARIERDSVFPRLLRPMPASYFLSFCRNYLARW